MKTLAELSISVKAETVWLPQENIAIKSVYTSDLLSDVMAHAPADNMLVTIQNHRNTVAVATLVNTRAILICHAREIPADMLSAAQGENIAILRTALNQFEASCLLGKALEIF